MNWFNVIINVLPFLNFLTFLNFMNWFNVIIKLLKLFLNSAVKNKLSAQ